MTMRSANVLAAMVVLGVPLLFAHVVRLLELKTAPLLAAARVGVAAPLELKTPPLEALVTALALWRLHVLGSTVLGTPSI